ncbi:MAG: hypothetical protein V7709_09505 [Halioglobus sp.]
MNTPIATLAFSGLLILLIATNLAAEERLETPSPVSGRSLSDPAGILPADALARVKLLRANVELLRLYMGRKRSGQPLLQVTEARPREVYSQALNLQLRANRLAFEQVRIVRSQSIAVNSDTGPADVFRVVDSALNSVLLVKQDMKIRTAVAEQIQPIEATPTDVLNEVVLAGTEINTLLQDMTSPSDVFQLVTAATHIAASLHASIPESVNLPAEPAFEPNKMPADVLIRMRRCFEMVSKLARAKGVDTLVLTTAEAENVSPNDVSDLAALLVEELQNIHEQFPDARPPAQAYYPGKRFPSHVYQRAGLLENILQDLISAYIPGSPNKGD